MSPFPICVVGAGYWGKNHIRTLYELNALGGIVEKDKNILKNYSSLYPYVKCYRSLDEALEKKHFIGFVVSTPANTHFDLAKTIIQSKRHVLIEKPMVLKMDHAEILVRLAKENNVNLMVGHLLLFHPAIIKIKEIISQGKIGELQYIYSNRLNLGQVRNEENVFWSLAPHDISIFQYITESSPKKIISRGSSLLQKGIHDSTITQFKYNNGVEGHIFVSWLHPFKEHRLVVIGTNGMISYDDSSKKKPLKLYAKKFDMSFGYPEKIDGKIKSIDFESTKPLENELKYFLNHLNGNKLQKADGKSGLDVVKILLEASNQLKEW